MIEKGQNKMDNDQEKVEWNPTVEIFNKYLDREVEQARSNIRVYLQQYKSASFRDLKESTLHSVDTLEEAINLELRAGKIKERKGYFTLV